MPRILFFVFLELLLMLFVDRDIIKSIQFDCSEQPLDNWVRHIFHLIFLFIMSGLIRYVIYNKISIN